MRAYVINYFYAGSKYETVITTTDAWQARVKFQADFPECTIIGIKERSDHQ